MNEGESLSRHERLSKFFREYYMDEIAELAQSYPRDQRSLVVDWSDLYQHWSGFADDVRAYPHGGDAVDRNPLRELHEALYDVDLPVDRALTSDEWPDAHVRIRLPESAQMGVGGIRSRDKGRYVALHGQIERVTQTEERITSAVFRCRKDHEQVTVPQPKDQLQEPGACPGSCSGKPSFDLIEHQSETVDERKLKLTQPPEESSGSGAELTVHLQDDVAFAESERSLMDMAGERVTIHGILKRDRSQTRGNQSAKPLFGTYLDAEHLEFEDSAADDIETEDHHDDIERHINADDTLERLIRSTSPGIRGGERMQQIKRGIVLYLFRAARKNPPDGGALRGDIHMALIGDPATGKTQLLDFVELVTPRVERLSGTDATGVGLTASATQDDFAGGEWVLKPGVLPRASGGHAIVDEIDKMDEGIDKLHEALETQRIHVSKAGMNATLKTECGVIVAANPSEGRFENMTDFTEQIDLPPALFGRFDIIHTLQDRPDKAVDENVAGAVLDRWQAGSDEDTDDGVPVALDTYRAWIATATRCEPVMTDKAKARLQEWYVEERSQEWDENADVIPVTARSIAAAARLAEAHARIHLRDEITTADAEVAIKTVRAVMGDVYLDDEGRMDADIITEAGPKSQKERREEVYKRIDDHDGPMPISKLVDDIDADESVIRNDVDHFMTKGELYNPRGQKYQTT